MANIKVCCVDCLRYADMPSDALLLTTSTIGESVRYAWICPFCKKSTVREAGREEVAMFRRNGVPEKRLVPQGPPFTDDDVIDLMLELESGAWL